MNLHNMMKKSHESHRIMKAYVICGFRYGDAKYYYVKNIQGDIVAVYDRKRNEVWGICL